MGLYKRVWIEKDPQYADLRRCHMEKVERYHAQFKFRIGTRRRNALTTGWCPFWESNLEQAVKELAFKVVRINSGMFFPTAEQRDAARSRAEQLRDQRIEHYKRLTR